MWPMSVVSGRRVRRVRSSIATLSWAMLSSAVPICCRSPASPWVRSPSSRISTVRSSRWEAVVSITTDMLVITRPITSSRSARWLVSFAVCAIRSLMVGPWPWRTAVISARELVDVGGPQQVEERLEGVEQRGQVEAGAGAGRRDVAPGESRLLPDPRVMSR